MSDAFDERSVFLAAVELNEEDRGAFLAGACPDAASLSRVRALLASHRAGFESLSTTDGNEAGSGGPIPEGGTRRLGPFRIEREVGRGGMGEVYLAVDEVLNRKVALKVIGSLLSSTPLAVEALHEEARTAASLTHPGVVRVYQFGQDRGRCYIASEFVEGPTLRDVIETERAARPRESRVLGTRAWLERSAAVISELADALDYCHRRNVVHRDVKPSNVLMEGGTTPRLTDFGIAQPGDGARSRDVLEGSCHYMSPEQATLRSVRVDARSDVFSLGVVLYEMLTLRRPFEGSDAGRVLASIRESAVAGLRTLDGRIPADLDTICQKCLEKRPEERYQTAGHVGAELRSWLKGEPILARPPGPSRRAWRWVSRRKWLFAAAAAAAVVGVAGVGAVQLERRKGMGKLVIPEMMRGSRISVAAIDESGGQEIRDEDLGRAPLTRWMKPGLYLVTFRYADGSLREAVSLMSPGYTDEVRVNSTDPAEFARMARIPAGVYLVGSKSEPRPAQTERRVIVGAFRISKTEVTNREYRAAVEAGAGAWGAGLPATWREPYDPAENELPVAGISWDQANAFCRWRGVRMPTSTEWEVATRWPDAREYPWGAGKRELSRSDSMSLEGYHNAVKPVDDDKEGTGQLAILHTGSNVSEFVASIAVDRNGAVVVKGRSYRGGSDVTLSRWAALPGREIYSPDVGFRVMHKE